MNRVMCVCVVLAGCTDADELQNGIYARTTTVIADSCLYAGQPAANPPPGQNAILTDGASFQLTFGEPVGVDNAIQTIFTLAPDNDYHAHLDTNTSCAHHVTDVTATELTSTAIRVEKTDDYEIHCAPDGIEPDASCTRSIEQSNELLTVCPLQCVTEDPPGSGQLQCCPAQ